MDYQELHKVTAAGLAAVSDEIEYAPNYKDLAAHAASHSRDAKSHAQTVIMDYLSDPKTYGLKSEFEELSAEEIGQMTANLAEVGKACYGNGLLVDDVYEKMEAVAESTFAKDFKTSMQILQEAAPIRSSMRQDVTAQVIENVNAEMQKSWTDRVNQKKADVDLPRL